MIRLQSLVLLLLALHAAPMPARAESLEEAWNIALAVNQRLRASGELTEAAEESLAAARAGRLPSMTNVEGYYTLSSRPAYKADLGFLGNLPIPFSQQSYFSSANSITQPLFTSGRLHNTIAAAQAGVHAAQSDESRLALDLKLNVAEAYVNVLYAQRLNEVADANVTDLAAHVRIVEDLIKQKQRVRGDRLAAEVQLADARQQALQTRNQLDIARAAYNRYLGRPLCEPVGLDDLELPALPEDCDALTAEALAQRPELAALSHQQEGLHRQADAVRAEVKPQVAAQGAFLYFQNQYLVQDSFWIANIGVRWDLDAGVTKHRARALDRRASATAAERADLESQIALQVRQALLDAETAIQRVQTTRVAIEQADENLKAAVDRYKNGVGTNTEVLDALTLRLRSSANYYNARYNAVLAVVRLRRAVGCL
ncbi:MAG: TolC family protein [Gemmataceae bacterium]|nr:TolC family protein [Gemmataceae bacterium]